MTRLCVIYNNGQVSEGSIKTGHVPIYPQNSYQTGLAVGVAGGALVAGGAVALGGSIACGILCGGTAATVATTGATTVVNNADRFGRAAEQGTKLLNGPINITSQRLQHVLDGHSINGIGNQGKSVFNAGENVVNLIRQGTQQVIEKQSIGSNFQRVFDVGRNIGIDRLTNQQTSTMTIITNKAGNLITSFPGKP